MNPFLHSPSQIINPLAPQRRFGFGSGVGGGGWTPAVLSPLIWFNAFTLAVADGDPVSTWTNDGTSGSGGNATAALTLRPTMDIDGINGGPAVLFDGVDDLMTYSHAATTAFTIWFIYKPTTIAGRHRVYEDTANRLVGFYDGNRTMFTGSFLNNGATSASVQVFIAQASSAGRSLRVNGATATDATSAGTLSGSARLGNPAETVKGHISELGLMNRILTAGELTSLVQYLTNKSGVSA